MSAKKKARQQKRIPIEVESGDEEAANLDEANKENTEELDQFEIDEGGNLEVDILKKGLPTMQDLLNFIKKADLDEALPHVMKLLELALTTPLTSVHCELVFSRMKRMVSTTRLSMLQTRKENLVFLQVEHCLLRKMLRAFHLRQSG